MIALGACIQTSHGDMLGTIIHRMKRSKEEKHGKAMILSKPDHTQYYVPSCPVLFLCPIETSIVPTTISYLSSLKNSGTQLHITGLLRHLPTLTTCRRPRADRRRLIVLRRWALWEFCLSTHIM